MLEPPLGVYLQPGGQRLGMATGLSLQGLSVISSEPLVPEQSLVLAIELPPALVVQDNRLLLVKGISVWSRLTPEGRYAIGFHLVRLPAPAAELIERLKPSGLSSAVAR